MKRYSIWFLLMFISCNTAENIKIELNRTQLIPTGPWMSSKDSLSGLAVSGKQMAFYKNETFNGDDMCRYEIIDSVKYHNNDRIILNTYLKAKYYTDTTYYKIVHRTDSEISLILKDGKLETFRHKKK
jgi:uncharacterized protein YgiM (DUF1202 family)